jgi:hypothetical protein
MERQRIDFTDIYRSFKLGTLHRRCNFTKTEELLAVMAVYEFLHNLDSFIDMLNGEGNGWHKDWYLSNLKDILSGEVFLFPNNYIRKKVSKKSNKRICALVKGILEETGLLSWFDRVYRERFGVTILETKIAKI